MERHPGLVRGGALALALTTMLATGGAAAAKGKDAKAGAKMDPVMRGMYIVSNRAFLEGKGAKSLVGKMAAELGKRPGAWLTYKDLEDGKFE